MNEFIIKANDYFNNDDFSSAFSVYKKAIENGAFEDKEELSEIYNLLGLISVFDRTVDTMDETGLFYFKKSLEINSENISALVNIITCFGDLPEDHKDVEITKQAIEKLKVLSYDFTVIEIQKINKILAI
ncbi:hypothetical protein [Flavobacterium sp. I3-2]|uniref:hypothetical protein n=1 Tax=Flavobacterium sp. I3-2 TaxID=2748319 RepID=UPI0015B1DB28|nr:hypothetical protein [Flavobacterium sp. I3-2]